MSEENEKIPEEKPNMTGIDWGVFDAQSRFVRITNNIAKKLKLTKWRMESRTIQGNTKPCLVFDVIMEDGKVVTKEFTVTALKAIQQFRPIIDKAVANGKTEINVSFLRVYQNGIYTFVIQEIPEA